MVVISFVLLQALILARPLGPLTPEMIQDINV